VFFLDFIDPVVFTFHFSCEFVLTLIFPMRCLLMFFKVIIGRDFFQYFCILFLFYFSISFSLFFSFVFIFVFLLSLYSFSRLLLIIPFSYVPLKYFSCIDPPAVTFFTSYGSSQCILNLPGC
jgi:hypothetical protein